MIAEKPIISHSPTRSPKLSPKPKTNWKLWLIVALLILAAASYLVFNDKGEADISEKRKKELQTDLEKYDNAEQYVLFATVSKFYPCTNMECDSIWLNVGEVYKYGVTINAQRGRGYSDKYLKDNSFRYRIQFVGNLAECMKQEKIRIYYYPTLPENIARLPHLRLNRPPGNPRDL